ncbi:MAG: serine/threonine protein kinase [Anaerolineales bacterium]|nr:serine/threonine protein kinase [Anaerolineales bacterium]
MPLTIGEILNKRYRIDRQIGKGGYGAVYRAFDLTLKQPCAIKENLNTQPEVQRQFEREALILARLRHPNLPRVIDHFVLPEQGQYLVMDFVEGHSLHILLKSQKEPFSEAEALSWIDQVCQALIYLHQQTPPIIHRDIKPQNIIITPAGRAMLVDFGLSKIYDEQLQTTVGARGLTYGYAPPEQYGQGRTDTRSDIYALGATLYTLLTKERPPDAIERLVNEAQLVPPGQLSHSISLHVEQAILKAMELNTSARFGSVESFRQALVLPATRPAVPVTAPAVPPRPKLWDWLRRALLGGLASLALAGTAGLGYWAWQTAVPAAGPGSTATQTASRVAGLPTLDPAPPLTPTVPPVSSTGTALSPVSGPSPTQLPTATPLPVPTDTLVPPTPTPAPPTDTPVPPPSPTPAFPFVVVGVEKRAEQPVTIFEGTISDASGNLLDGIFVQAICGTYSTISFPSGATPWGSDKGLNAWPPGHYDINLAQPQPCAWQLTIVDTDDRKTVKANLSAPLTIEVSPGESPIIVDWRKLY